MHFFYDFLYQYPYLALAQTAFMVWMLVDAYRRHADFIWFWVIILLPILGAWIYFFVIKAPELQTGKLSALFQRRQSLDELRYLAEQAPTLANHLAYAERLMERGEYAEAVPQLEAARKREPDHGQVLYSLAFCQVRLGRPAEGLPLLDRLVKKDPRWSNYSAWRLKIEAHGLTNNPPAALESCRELVKLSPTLQHKCILAEHLLAQGQDGEVQALLDQALMDHDYCPGPIRRKNRRWAGEAKKLLKRVGAAKG
jgi:hypothetical protein